MPLLEFVCKRLMGPPVCGSCWRCPFCDSSGSSFSVRPPKGDYAIKFKCFRCDRWGDELDLLEHFYPDEDKSQICARWTKLRHQHESARPESKSSFSLRGTGHTRSVGQQHSTYRDDPQDVALVWSDLGDEFRDDDEISNALLVRVLTPIVERCEASNVSVPTFLKYCQDFEDFIRKSDQQHLAGCDDPECEADVCRVARGLRSLTKAEWEEIQQQAKEARRQRTERTSRAIRKLPDSPTSPRKLVTMKGIPKRKLRAR